MITYFIRHRKPRYSAIKIGRARSVAHRLLGVRDFPSGIRLLGFIDGDVESQWHRKYSKDALTPNHLRKPLKSSRRSRVGGREWFRASAELLTEILETATTTKQSRAHLQRNLAFLLRSPKTSVSAMSRMLSREDAEHEHECTHYFASDVLRMHENVQHFLRCMAVGNCSRHECVEQKRELYRCGWEGPYASCRDCSIRWGVEKLLDRSHEFSGIGVNLDERVVWLYLKSLNSQSRTKLVDSEFLEVAFSLRIGDWRLMGRDLQMQSYVLVDWDRIAHSYWRSLVTKAVAGDRRQIKLSDASVAWLSLRDHQQWPEGVAYHLGPYYLARRWPFVADVARSQIDEFVGEIKRQTRPYQSRGPKLTAREISEGLWKAHARDKAGLTPLGDSIVPNSREVG